MDIAGQLNMSTMNGLPLTGSGRKPILLGSDLMLPWSLVDGQAGRAVGQGSQYRPIVKLQSSQSFWKHIFSSGLIKIV